ncbi:MAG: efflux transporter outer membrane subunit [Proteobacteria bacterium]|nr:efflux transporter outer membrane subunit [Pseudomonadota bacterium]
MPTLPRLAFAALAGLLASGCSVGPDYLKPALSTPEQYNNQANFALRTAQGQADLTHWWDGFNDPLLSKLVQQALTDNLDLAQASARIAQARALLGAARAALLPSAALGAHADRGHQSVQTPLGRVLDASSPNFDRDGSYFEAGIAASWELDFFGGRRREREAAMAGVEATEAGAAAVRLGVAAQTADTYLLIRGLQQRIAIAREQASAQRQLLDMVKLQYDAGVAAELQLKQAESLVYQTETTVPALEAALEAALNALDIGIGAQPGTYHAELSATAAVPVPPGIAQAGGPVDLLRRRPDLIAAERRLAATNAAIGAAIAEYYPKISLKGLLGTATTAFGGAFSGGANQAQGSVGLRWRLFDFARIEAEIAASRGRYSEALAAYKLAVLVASGDVENAITALVQSEAQERLLAAGEQALARAHETSLAAYQGGTVSLIEVLDADMRLLATRDARAVARTTSARAAVASFKALGGG